MMALVVAVAVAVDCFVDDGTGAEKMRSAVDDDTGEDVIEHDYCCVVVVVDGDMTYSESDCSGRDYSADSPSIGCYYYLYY